MRASVALCLVMSLCVSPFTRAGVIQFGSAESFTMAVASHDPWQGNLLLGSEAHIFGSVASSAVLELGSGVQIDGDACASTQHNWGATVSGSVGHCSNFANLADDITSAARQAEQLPQQTLGNITGSAQLTSSQGSVFGLNDLVLGSGDWLTLSGLSSDFFVLNVYGQAKLGSGAGIQLTGGLLAQNVVFNFVASPLASSFEIGGATLTGTYLSDGRSFILGDGATLAQTRFYSTANIIANVQDVSDFPNQQPSSIPAPSTLWLWLVATCAVFCTRGYTLCRQPGTR